LATNVLAISALPGVLEWRKLGRLRMPASGEVGLRSGIAREFQAMENGIVALKAACSAQPALTAPALIKQGQTNWLGGRAAHAPDGMIGLAQKGGFKLLIPENQIIAVEKHDELWLVQVRSDTDILITLEKVAKANLSGCSCREIQPSLARTTDAGTTDADAGTFTECTLSVECETYDGVWVCLITGVHCK
jgi:hypothetical protein